MSCLRRDGRQQQCWQLLFKQHKHASLENITKKQRQAVTLNKDNERELRIFWRLGRGVQSKAHEQRLINFARLYPRYRDLPYLKNYLPYWDQAIRALMPHDRGMAPANVMARRHPMVLTLRTEPLQLFDERGMAISKQSAAGQPARPG
ncbi:hypothetical protein WJX81_001435 [Elliptochloris bilobata]|uniref:Uncharacterized protein n=1 Tax=Elliptochloris bilobata TaxID=381761 RepID=A0AAW1SKC6_9CHLO